MADKLYYEDLGTLTLALSDFLLANYGDFLKPHGIDLEADEHFVPLGNLIHDFLERFSEGGYQNYN